MTHDHPRPRSQFPSCHNKEKLVAVIAVSSEHRNEISETLLLDLDALWMHVKIIDDRYDFSIFAVSKIELVEIIPRCFHQRIESFLFHERDRFYADERGYLVQALEKREGCEILERLCL